MATNVSGNSCTKLSSLTLIISDVAFFFVVVSSLLFSFDSSFVCCIVGWGKGNLFFGEEIDFFRHVHSLLLEHIKNPSQ